MARRIGLWALYLVPLGYVGMIVAVTIHEAIDHGGAAMLSGGEFLGFDITYDGMGHAWTDGEGDEVLVLAGGIASEAIAGWLLMAVALFARGRPLIRAFTRAIPVAWAAVGACVLAIALSLEEGVHWS